MSIKTFIFLYFIREKISISNKLFLNIFIVYFIQKKFLNIEKNYKLLKYISFTINHPHSFLNSLIHLKD